MRAYAVFDGGGVKGAALAGCLAAAEKAGIEFVGFGGTSAGSMVAFLASVGMNGPEIGDALRNKSFVEFFDDGSNRLDAARKAIRRIRRSGLCKKYLAYRTLRRLFDRNFGLYDGDRVSAFLWELVKPRLKEICETAAELKFSDLPTPLKIVATDISRRRAAIFPRDCSLYGDSVLAAVQASAGYPFVFKPWLANGAYVMAL